VKVLVTGAAGFIGSHITEYLLKTGKNVIGVDNLSTGRLSNISKFRGDIEFLELDILNLTEEHLEGVTHIVHQAALGSVPASIDSPQEYNKVNIEGFVHLLELARKLNIKRVVYASSAAVYGTDSLDVKEEDSIGAPLSPYAITKYVDELYANLYGYLYGLECIGLRYFNVFGPKQDLNGSYAAVIPAFITSLLNSKAPTINGTGEATRDFVYVQNIVQANILALTTQNAQAFNSVFNVGNAKATSILDLYNTIASIIGTSIKPVHGPIRPGDIKHSVANISKATAYLNYNPTYSVVQGLYQTVEYYKK